MSIIIYLMLVNNTSALHLFRQFSGRLHWIDIEKFERNVSVVAICRMLFEGVERIWKVLILYLDVHNPNNENMMKRYKIFPYILTLTMWFRKSHARKIKNKSKTIHLMEKSY